MIGKNKSVEFRQIFYGAYNGNSELIAIATRIMPKDLQWKVVFLNEDGDEQSVIGKSRTGRTITRTQITSDTVDSPKIKQFIKSTNIGKTENNGTESTGGENNENA